MKAFITRIRFSRNRWVWLLAGLISCAAAEAQQTQCYAVTFGHIESGNGAVWNGKVSTFEQGAADTLANDHDCWADGKGGCLPLAIASCSPSGYPTSAAAFAECTVVSPEDPNFWFVDYVWAASQGCLFWIQVPKGESCSTNCVHDPIDPAIGSVYRREEDVTVGGSRPTIAFERSYNSADTTGSDTGPGWRHSYDRSITVNYGPLPTAYPPASIIFSSQYSTAANACTSGFAAIQSQVPGWQGATVSYANNVCVISTSAGVISTVPISTSYSYLLPTTPVEYDVVRDDGQTLRYTV
jgi:Domain of unknown function (DUF6531)